MALPTTERITTLLRDRAHHLAGRLREALDLPSRTELTTLTARLEELDRRIAALAAERVAAMATAVPALPAAEEAVADEPAVQEPTEASEAPADGARNGKRAKQRRR